MNTPEKGGKKEGIRLKKECRITGKDYRKDVWITRRRAWERRPSGKEPR